MLDIPDEIIKRVEYFDFASGIKNKIERRNHSVCRFGTDEESASQSEIGIDSGSGRVVDMDESERVEIDMEVFVGIVTIHLSITH